MEYEYQIVRWGWFEASGAISWDFDPVTFAAKQGWRLVASDHGVAIMERSVVKTPEEAVKVVKGF